MLFSELSLAAPLLKAVAASGYTTPTAIQAQAIPPAAEGRDVLGCAQTGTGKTAAFALPVLHRLLMEPPRSQDSRRTVRALILSPTRELAKQIDDSFRTYGKGSGLRGAVIYGGVGQGPQVDALRRGLDVLIATPGRLCDLMQQGYVDLSHVEIFVLDEADRMLDMGFLPDVKRIIAELPDERQTLFFSATMAGEISQLANELLNDPVKISITPAQPTVERIEQYVSHISRVYKPRLMVDWLRRPEVQRSIIFTRTKHGADKVTRWLLAAELKAEAIHGNKSQNARQRTLMAFRSGFVQVLVATDVAARGIDIDGVTHVFNYDLPHEPETYVHRIGRTGRAGADGIAVSFCDDDERGMLRAIERMIHKRLPVAAVPDTLPHVPKPPPLPEGEDRDERPRGRSAPAGGGAGGRRPFRNDGPAPEGRFGAPVVSEGAAPGRRPFRSRSANPPSSPLGSSSKSAAADTFNGEGRRPRPSGPSGGPRPPRPRRPGQ